MLRIDMDYLKIDENKFYYKEDRFTGVAISHSENIINKVLRYENGDCIGSYKGDIILLNDHKTLVDYKALEAEGDGTDVPYHFNGDAFTGAAFMFDTGVCVAEEVYEDGWLGNSVSYSLEGNMLEVDLMENDFAQRIGFFETGEPKDIYLFERDKFHAHITFDATDVIKSINLEENYFERVTRYKDKIHCPVFDTKGFATAFSGGESVYLSGTSTDDEVLAGLASANGLSKTSEVRISRTPISQVGLALLMSITGLNKLIIESEVLDVDDMKRFKIKRPDCYVELNREEITL
jgi:hypothetical protein